MLFKIKIAIIVGHTERYQGYDSPYLLPEWEWNSQVAEKIKEINTDITVIKHRPSDKWYTRRQKNTAKKTKDFDYIFELHYNAATPRANGTECFHYITSTKGKRAAQIIAQEISNTHDTKLRGDKGARALWSNKQRGFGFVALHTPPAVIIEPFFGSNKVDTEKFNVEDYACTLVNAFWKL